MPVVHPFEHSASGRAAATTAKMRNSIMFKNSFLHHRFHPDKAKSLPQKGFMTFS